MMMFGHINRPFPKHKTLNSLKYSLLYPISPSLFNERLVLCSSTFYSVDLHKTKTRLKYSLSKQWEKAIQSAFNLIMWLIVPITFEPVRPCELLFGRFILPAESWMGHFLQLWPPHDLISLARTMRGASSSSDKWE